MSKRLLPISAVLAFACVSCNNGLYPTSGKVTYKGQPAAGATVYFYRQKGDPLNEHMIMGIVQEDGSFTLVCGPHGKGAPAGEYDVLIEWKQGPNRGKGRVRKMPDKLNGRYADPRRPLLHANLKAEANNLPPFELTD
jgi:hypothetical protein